MLCGRGKKRKSLDDYEDRENLLMMDNGDYVCMQRPHDVRHKKRLLVDPPASRGQHDVPRAQGVTRDQDYVICRERKGLQKGVLKNRGQLHVAIYVNCGLLTVHVIQASHLSMKQTNENCSAYVKVRLSPDQGRRSRCKTETAHKSSNPVFDEKFSFELLEEDLRKRILISVWHREKTDDHSECLGCMSFGIQHILSHKKTVDGWYYLLTEDIGKRKHLLVATRPRFASPVRETTKSDHQGSHQHGKRQTYHSPERNHGNGPLREHQEHRQPNVKSREAHRTLSPIRHTGYRDGHTAYRDGHTAYRDGSHPPQHVVRHEGESYQSYQSPGSQDVYHLASPVELDSYSFDSPIRGPHYRAGDDFLPCSPITPIMTPLHGVPHAVPNNSPLSSAPTTPVKDDLRLTTPGSRSDNRPSTPGKEAPSRRNTEVKVDTEPVYAEVTSTPSCINQDIVSLEPHVFVIKRGDYGYGFSITGSSPVRVSRVDPDTPAESVGLQREDLIVRLNGTNMAKATAETVARVIKSSEKKIIMEVERPTRTLPPGQEDTPQFSDTHPLVNTPEYTPLVFKTKPCRRIIRSPSPHRDDCKQDKKGLKSIGICAALPMRRVRFFDDVT